ncbi:MAG: hypothetical protein M3M95_06220 [Pseudomonadota bacterium]|nr:hypothetical protein [Pseudomonadota bacterium]
MIRKAAALAVLVIGSGAAWTTQASVIVLGSTRAHACMDAAFAGARDRTAIATCTAALEEQALSPKDRAATLVNRGVLLMNRLDFQAAFSDFDDATRINPKLGEAAFNRGSALIALGRYSEGLVDIERGLQLGVREPEKAYYNRAIAREELDDPKGAYLDYRQAARLKPEWDLPRLELARFEVRQAQ